MNKKGKKPNYPKPDIKPIPTHKESNIMTTINIIVKEKTDKKINE